MKRKTDSRRWRALMRLMARRQRRRDEALALARLFRKLDKQEPLGEPFAFVLHDNLWNLYAR